MLHLCSFSSFMLNFHQQMAVVDPGFGWQIVVCYSKSLNALSEHFYDNLNLLILHCENYIDLRMCCTYIEMLLFMSKCLNTFH